MEISRCWIENKLKEIMARNKPFDIDKRSCRKNYHTQANTVVFFISVMKIPEHFYATEDKINTALYNPLCYQQYYTCITN